MEKMDLEVQAHGQVTSEWYVNRAEEIDSLIDCSWFNLNELGVEVGGDDRLRLQKGVVREIPEEETKENLKSASDLIADYFTIVVKFLENPELIETGPSKQDESGDWGTEEFLLGLFGRRRGGGFS